MAPAAGDRKEFDKWVVLVRECAYGLPRSTTFRCVDHPDMIERSSAVRELVERERRRSVLPHGQRRDALPLAYLSVFSLCAGDSGGPVV
jgi:hypothetical protein